MDFLDVCVQILSGTWNVLTWGLQFEERLAMLMNEYGVQFADQIITLCVVNTGLIPLEYGVVHLCWVKSKWFRNIGTPKWARRIAREKPLTLWDLTILAFIPAGTQKVGIIAWHAKRDQFGWRGYLFLAFGGCARVSLYPLFGRWLWLIVVGVILLRLVDLWWNHANGKRVQERTQ